MSVRKACRVALAFLVVSISCPAQQSTLTIDAVLARVREHIAEYKTTVPSFVSDESVLSQRSISGKLKDQTKLESSFEVRHKDASGNPGETRTVRLVDGRPLKKNKGFVLPYRYTGAVSDAFWFFEDKCSAFRFAEEPGESNPIVIETSREPVTGDCPLISQTTVVKAFIDPENFQVTRLVQTVQDLKWIGPPKLAHLFPSDHSVKTDLIDYAPVELGGKIYWLTKSVTSDVNDKPGIEKPLHLHYEAHYSNYHKYASTVKILPDSPLADQVAAAATAPTATTVATTSPTIDAVATSASTAAAVATTLPAIGTTATAVATTAPIPAPTPEKTYSFDVVSMRQNKTTSEEDLLHFEPTPSGYHVKNMSLRNILITAFAPQIGGGVFYTTDQIKGISDWADSTRYEIEARISDRDRAEWQNPERQKMMLRAMLQSLLSERCKLVVHREIKVTKVYSLELAKGGPKFHESKPDEVFPPGIKLPWGGVVVPTGDGMRMYGTTMASFATVLAEETDSTRSIQDKTGLTGKYNIILKADLSAPPPEAPPSNSESDWDSSVLAAVNTLGLKLVSTEAPVEMLIVDHLDRPTEN